MNLFGFLHRERELRRLRAAHAELQQQHNELREDHDEAVEARDYFKRRYVEEYERAEQAEGRAIDAETVVVCLDGQLAEERQKTASQLCMADAASPIFDQISSERPLPVFEDGETTVQARQTVRTLADALGGVQ